MTKSIPLSVPNLSGNELKYVTKAIEDEWVSTGGSYIDEFENVTADYANVKGAVACQSGTAGIHLALIINNVTCGDEVIVPTLTFIAAVNPIKYLGAEPVFMDCDDSLCMDMCKVEEFCNTECTFYDGKLINNNSKKHIKAMIVVHVFGNMVDMEKAVDISKRYNLALIEDATEALGSFVISGLYAGKYAGTIGDVGVYSYNGNKIITTGGGGMIVSNDEYLLKKAKYLSTQAKDDPLYYVHNNIGYNYRMTNIQAALGLAQFEQLETFINIKKRNYDRYKKNGVKLLDFKQNIRANYWFYSHITEKREELIKFLSEQQIQSRPIWNLINELKPYRKCATYRIEKALFYIKKIVNVPCSTNLSEEEIITVSNAINKFERGQ